MTFKLATQFFLHSTLAHGDTPSYQVWLQKVEWFRRHSLAKAQTQGVTDTVITVYTPNFFFEE